MKSSTKRYLNVFLITTVIFLLVLWLSNELSNRKITELKSLEDQIGLNILSTETRFSLLEKTSCDHVMASKDNSIGLNSELAELAKKVKFMESQLGVNNKDVISLNKYYTLLQIKDYLLTLEFHTRCNENIASILYFHKVDCSACAKQSIILDKVSSEYPEVRIYWLDKDTDTPALKTMTSLFNIKDSPALVIGEKTYNGFQSYEQIESYIPEIQKWKKEKENALKAAQTTSTKTVSTSTKK
jgi:hypothetical protein